MKPGSPAPMVAVAHNVVSGHHGIELETVTNTWLEGAWLLGNHAWVPVNRVTRENAKELENPGLVDLKPCARSERHS